MAAIPPEVSDAQAATLPTAGMTALRALEVAGLVLGKRVLVTGATGGVGRMAIQLARESGALVTALVRDVAASQELLRGLGAAEVGEEITGDFDLIVDGVGARDVRPRDRARGPARRRRQHRDPERRLCKLMADGDWTARSSSKTHGASLLEHSRPS